MSNLDLWNKFRSCPKEAQKTIGAGRLKGMTDVNPVWRIKVLTEQYGPCGIGWYYDVTARWLESGANGEIVANVEIDLYVKDKEWSKPIHGIGGSMLVAKETAGLHTSDEAYKMALTDAISVSCKALGIAADIYWDKDATKYTKPEAPAKKTAEIPKSEEPIAMNPITEDDIKALELAKIDIKKVAIYFKTTPEELTHKQAQEALAMKKGAK